MKKIIFVFSFSVLISACSPKDPILEGLREPIFKQKDFVVLSNTPKDLGEPLKENTCDYTIDSKNQIWNKDKRVFAGLPTEAKIDSSTRVICNGNFIYAGLSTGELVKIDTKTNDLVWTTDIFAENLPTGGSPFLDIVANPVYNNGFIYAGGLGDAFCKVKDSDGAKIWCLPISVQKITNSTKDFNVVNEIYAVSVDGKVYKWQK